MHLLSLVSNNQFFHYMFRSSDHQYHLSPSMGLHTGKSTCLSIWGGGVVYRLSTVPWMKVVVLMMVWRPKYVAEKLNLVKTHVVRWWWYEIRSASENSVVWTRLLMIAGMETFCESIHNFFYHTSPDPSALLDYKSLFYALRVEPARTVSVF